MARGRCGAGLSWAGRLGLAPAGILQERRPGMTLTSLPDPAMVRECHARARAWAAMFRLPLRQQNWRGLTGQHAGQGTGSSLDFHDHRAYSPGDDPRHINWQAYARTGHYSMK